MGSNRTTRFAKLLRGELEFEQMLEHDRTAHPHYPNYTSSPQYIDLKRHALFYAGVKGYEENNHEITLRLWRKVTSIEEPSLDLSYYIMEHERTRLEDTQS